MTKIQNRSMDAEFAQGAVDETYIQLVPDRGNVENPPLERLMWPTYGMAEHCIDHPFLEAHMRRAALPWEVSRGTQSIVQGTV
jgi:hypothetical protein